MWRFFLLAALAKRGYMLASETVLKEICTPDELVMLKRTSRILAKEVAADDGSDDSGSSNGGSPNQAITDPTPTGEELILG